MNYLDHLYYPVQEDALNEISVNFIAHKLNNAMEKASSKFKSAENAYKARARSFRGVPNYKIDKNSAAWRMPTMHASASMDVHDKIHKKLNRVEDKAHSYLTKKLGTSKNAQLALYAAKEKDRDSRG